MKQKQAQLEKWMSSCDPNPQNDIVAFVSKVFHNNSPLAKAVKPRARNEAPRTENLLSIENNSQKLVAFARIFCGTIHRGQEIYVLGPKYNPLDPTKYVSKVVIEELYLLMGAHVEPVEKVPAGNVFGIGVSGDAIIKTATLSTTLFCPSFNIMTFASSPIVRFALEPENPSDLPILVEGLKLLNQADPCVECLVQETGEHVIIASGELHLERCLRDLRESFAKIPFRVSPPIVPFRETITNDPACKSIYAPNININLQKDGIQTANKKGSVLISAIPLPENLRKFLEQHTALLRQLYVKETADPVALQKFMDDLKKELEEAGGRWPNELEKIWAFGPKSGGPNILLNHIPEYSMGGNWLPFVKRVKLILQENQSPKKGEENVAVKSPKLEEENKKEEEVEEKKEESETHLHGKEKELVLKELDHSIRSGFQLATSAGPLCEEPLSGVCFIIEDISIQTEHRVNEERGPFSGQIMSAIKEACRQAFLSHSARLIQPMFFCEVQTPPETVGSVCSVLGRRRAKILQEEIKEGTSIFTLEALLPVMESFGLSDELMTQTSGAANMQLFFHGWEVLDQDPYWVATTEEELEDIGENLGGIAPNLSRQYMDSVRKRKGLPVVEKIVEHGDKQRTLKRNK